jgi:hypothetical protein
MKVVCDCTFIFIHIKFYVYKNTQMNGKTIQECYRVMEKAGGSKNANWALYESIVPGGNYEEFCKQAFERCYENKKKQFNKIYPYIDIDNEYEKENQIAMIQKGVKQNSSPVHIFINEVDNDWKKEPEIASFIKLTQNYQVWEKNKREAMKSIFTEEIEEEEAHSYFSDGSMAFDSYSDEEPYKRIKLNY